MNLRDHVRQVVIPSCCGIAALITLAGCSTLVSGRRAGDAEGVHYWLPKPILVVTPNSDGTLTVKPDYIPDGTNEYVVSAKSFIGSYTFEVHVDQGLLTTVNMNSDNTAAAKAVADSLRDVEKARIDARKAAATAQATKQAATDTKVEAAKLAVRQAQYALDEAIAHRDALKEQGAKKEDIDTAELAITKAQSDLKAAQSELAYVLGTSTTADNADAGTARKAPVSRTRAAGPVLYTIQQSRDDNGPTVRLVESRWTMESKPDNGGPVSSGQLYFDTAMTANPPAAASKPAASPFKVAGTSKLKMGQVKLTLDAKAHITALEPSKGENGVIKTKGSAERKVSLTLRTDGQKKQQVDVQLPNDIKPGDYTLEFRYKDESGKKLSADVTFSVVP